MTVIEAPPRILPQYDEPERPVGKRPRERGITVLTAPERRNFRGRMAVSEQSTAFSLAIGARLKDVAGAWPTRRWARESWRRY